MKLFKYLAGSALLICSIFSASAQLPSVSLKTLDGATVDSSTLTDNDGKPVVISFFATWCKPCLRELKAVNENYLDWADETGMRFIAISIDEAQTSSKVRPLADSEGWEFDVLLDPNSDFARKLGVQGVPHLVILNGEGKVIESHMGYTDGSEEHIIELVREEIEK